jgi:hypothetical protein
MWESLLFALIGKYFCPLILCAGEQFEEPGVIGASLSLRAKEQLVQVWIHDGRDDRLRANVGNKLRHFLNLDPTTVTLYYKQHIQSIKDGSTMKNAEGFKFIKQPAARQPPRSSYQKVNSHYGSQQDYEGARQGQRPQMRK